MNMNATAQMVTTTQVGCGKPNYEKLYRALLIVAEQQAKELGELRQKKAKRKKKSNVPPERPPQGGHGFRLDKRHIGECEVCGRPEAAHSSYPVPPHTMTNRGHLRDIG